MPVLGKSSHRCDAVPMSCLRRCCVGLSAGLLALVCGTAAASQWRSGWGLAGSPPAPASDTATPQLQLRQRGTLIQVWVDHRGFGPVQVRLRNRQPGASPLLPLLRTLRGPGQQLLLELPAGPAYQLVLDSVPGQPQSASQAFEYRLPFDPAAGVRVHQGAHGRASHHDAQNRYAWDFALAEGTPVLAARAGRVMATRSSACCTTNVAGDGGNWVRIEHEDGSMAIYAHLQAGSLAVTPGQRIAQGQPLGRVGNTGYSRGAHLHFAVQINTGLSLHSIPVQLNGPQGRLQASSGSTGP